MAEGAASTCPIAVDAVLVIGEHGDYPANQLGQKLCPRYEFFKQVTDVFKKDGRAVPVFNDKHLSWKWARETVETARTLDPFRKVRSQRSRSFLLNQGQGAGECALLSPARRTSRSARGVYRPGSTSPALG